MTGRRFDVAMVLCLAAACARPPALVVGTVAVPVTGPTLASTAAAESTVQQTGVTIAEVVSAADETGRNTSPPPIPVPAPTDPVVETTVTTAEISARTVAVFGDSGATASTGEATEPSWDIDVRSYASTARVEFYVRRFTGDGRDRIASRLSRGTQYEPMIRRVFREQGIPEDMYYLALIESGFDAHAYSSAAAVGMWQFMTTTAKGMGLRVDGWVDERRDPIRSTIAAARFLGSLRDQFGSMYLAAAAYNGGPGRISRGLTRFASDLEGTSGDDLFFALAEKEYLKGETKEYVPQLIAAALIAKTPERYGMTIPTLPPFMYDSVRVGALASLPAVARAASVELATVRDLNPFLLRGMTAPGDSAWVRLPVGAAEGFADAYAALDAGERAGARLVATKEGETLVTFARRTGTTSARITAINGNIRRLKSGKLAAGQRLYVPSAAVTAAARLVPDPAIERYGSVVRGVRTHVVKKGETLGHIALRYGTSVKALMASNRMRKNVIIIGQRLVIPR